MDKYCVLCKKVTEGRFEVTVVDNKTQVVTDSTLCRDCYNRVIKNHGMASGSVKISKIGDWIKKKK